MSLPLLVAFVALLRLGELAWAGRNTRRLLAAGGVEHGRRHYPLFVILHSAWLTAVLIWGDWRETPDPVLLGIFALLQCARLWVILSLGPYWTTRIITLAGTPLVRRGPYRVMRHPNYLIVASEMAVLPLAFGLWEVAIAFFVTNAALLFWRIRAEERALAPRRRDQRSWNEDWNAT